jgi:hypothetical protein
MSNAYVIIGIHGLANKPAKEVLENWWRKSILEGLQRNEGRTASDVLDVSFESVYWADWNYDKPIPEEENSEPYESAHGEGPLPRYDDSFWDELRADAQDLLDTPLDWAKRFFGMDAIAGAVLKAKLQDLALYYDDRSKRELLRDRLEETISKHRGKRLMVIAHSMGSIVAYDVLRRLGKIDSTLRIDHFVTIGSPLGLPHVKHRIYEENDLVRTPSIVRRWTNFSDRRDPVALDTHLSDDFKANDRSVKVKDDLVLNGYQNPEGDPNFHKSYGYLRTPEISRLIRSFI